MAEYRNDGTRWTEAEAAARRAWMRQDRRYAMRRLAHYSANQREEFLRRIGVTDNNLINRWANAEV